MALSSQGNPAQFCGHCGAPLKPDAKFCSRCGAPATAGTARQPAGRASGRQPASSRNPLALLIVGAGLVLIVVSAVVLLLNPPAGQVGTASTSGNPASVPTVAAPQPDIPYPDVLRIDPAEAYALATSGEALIVDVRDRQSYDQAHAEGALSIPLDELPQRLGELPKELEIITYCT